MENERVWYGTSIQMGFIVESSVGMEVPLYNTKGLEPNGFPTCDLF